MNLHRNNKKTIILLSSVLIILIGALIIFLSIKKATPYSSVQSSPDLVNHPIYSNYNFDQNDSVINIGIQPMYLLTGIIMEVIKRDKILNKSLASLGKRINYHPFCKGADVNFFLTKKIINYGVGCVMSSLVIESYVNCVCLNI